MIIQTMRQIQKQNRNTLKVIIGDLEKITICDRIMILIGRTYNFHGAKVLRYSTNNEYVLFDGGGKAKITRCYLSSLNQKNMGKVEE